MQFNLDDTAGTATTLGSMLRKWNIRVTQIPCGEVPSECVQYFMGTEGVVSSYGFPSGQLLSQQNYKACIRQELGGLSFDYNKSIYFYQLFYCLLFYCI